jgi:hypothetical protein
VSKKQQRGEHDDDLEGGPSTWWWVVGGVAVVLVSAGIAIALFTAFGGSSLSEEDPDTPELPPLGAAPSLERSAAADLLEDKSFDDMTADELELVKSEATRVYADAEFRASNSFVRAIDVIRRDGHTVASRQYTIVETPGGTLANNEITSFYCDSEVEGFIDIYRSRSSIVRTNTEGLREQEGSQAFERIISATDWSDPTDLGYDEIDGRRVHGVEVKFAPLSGGEGLGWQLWFDVETAQLLRNVDMNAPGAPYTLRWGEVPRMVPVEELGTPPCYAQVYADD